MPANKIQHFVPRCYLRPFCTDDDGAAINLLNISGEFLVQDAPAKGQCARDYFYGKDGIIEKGLQTPEGVYSQILKKVEGDPEATTGEDLRNLLSLMLLQSFRSAAWMERHEAEMKAFHELLKEEATPQLLESLKSPRGETIKMAFAMYEKMLPAVADLRVCIIVNNSRREFITSDDPVVHTNRFHIQKRILGGHGYGSAGAMFFMPMTPKLLLTAFDPNVYRLEGRVGHFAKLRDARDVENLNQLQVIHASKNLYFRNWEASDLVLSSLDRGKKNRRSSWSKIEILRETQPNSNEFVAIDQPYEFDPARREMVHTERNLPTPDTWPKLLPYVLRPKVVDTGSAAGLRRPTLAE